MKLWATIKRLSVGQGFRLMWLLAQRPLLIWPTWKATKETMQVCDTLFGKIHHKNGKANAFRHALWNIRICEKTRKFTKNDNKSAKWAQKVTDLHEKLAKNDILDTEMDYHNNEIGRMLFLGKKDQNELISNDFLLKKLENAQKVMRIEDFDKIDNELVFILE